jgi:RND family efflux transporter MFP subunit
MNRLAVGTAALLAGMMLLAGCARKAPPPPSQPPEVSVSHPIERKVADYVEFTGRTDAVNYVEVRARVKGYLVKVNFTDGQLVKTGAVLYEIDPRPYQASLAEAKGTLAKTEGSKQLADIQVERYTKLVAKGAASAQDLDEWRGKQAEATGAVAAAKGQLQSAQLNLDFCTIASPIDGQVSRTYFTIGNLVTPDTTTLTTIASIDPMYAYFSVDEPTFLRIIEAIRSGELKGMRTNTMPLSAAGAGRTMGLLAAPLGQGPLLAAAGLFPTSTVPVELGLADDVERKFPLRGTLDFVNNQVDRQTATITVRGTFANPYDPAKAVPPLLKPGMFVRVRVQVGPQRQRLLVNERAIGTDQGFKFVYVVDADDRVRYCRVKLGPREGALQVVEGDGDELNAGDWVVVNGLQRCRPRAEVRPVEVDMVTLKPVRPSTTPRDAKRD